MKSAAVVLGMCSGAAALTIGTVPSRAGTVKMMPAIGDSGVEFETVAREWRCKYSPGESGGPGDSASLKACNDLLTEYLPKLKALEGAEVTRQVCGGCMDFKVSITQPLEPHGAFMEDLALEEVWRARGTKQQQPPLPADPFVCVRLCACAWEQITKNAAPQDRGSRAPDRDLWSVVTTV